MKSKLKWSYIAKIDEPGWRHPTINEARNYSITSIVECGFPEHGDFIKVTQDFVCPHNVYVSTRTLSVQIRGAYSDSNLLCSGNIETEPPAKHSLVSLYSATHTRGHSTYACSNGATVQDCIETWIHGKSLWALGSFCRTLGRETAIQVVNRFDPFFLERFSVVLSNDFRGSKNDALRLLEDAQFMHKLGWDVYEASIATRHGMSFEQARSVSSWGVNQSDYAQMLVHNAGTHADVERIVNESDSSEVAYNLQLFFAVIKEETRLKVLL